MSLAVGMRAVSMIEACLPAFAGEAEFLVTGEGQVNQVGARGVVLSHRARQSASHDGRKCRRRGARWQLHHPPKLCLAIFNGRQAPGQAGGRVSGRAGERA